MFTSIRRTIVATATALAVGLGGVGWATSGASAAPAAVSAPAVSAADASAPAAPACSTPNLSVWVNLSQGSVAAGTDSWPLDFTNTGRHACTLHGYPDVSATNANGARLGRAAEGEPIFSARTVTIGAGGTAHAYLLWTE